MGADIDHSIDWASVSNSFQKEPSPECPSIDILSKVAAAPRYTFGSKSKTGWDKDESMPGPGSYFDSSSARNRGSVPPKFSFGVASRQAVDKPRAPGPGEYGCRTTFDSSKGFSCTPRRSHESKYHKKPGPGAHNVPLPSKLDAGPRHTITPRRHADGLATERTRPTPGPGQYLAANDVQPKVKPPQWGFGSAPRTPRDMGQTCPGPGAYWHERNLNGKGPKWSMRARTANAKVGIIMDPAEFQD